MNDYQVGVIKFDNNAMSLRLMSMVDAMEQDRLAGWSAFFKKDYECEQLKEELRLCRLKKSKKK